MTVEETGGTFSMSGKRCSNDSGSPQGAKTMIGCAMHARSHIAAGSSPCNASVFQWDVGTSLNVNCLLNGED